jgi:hypothetical protein
MTGAGSLSPSPQPVTKKRQPSSHSLESHFARSVGLLRGPDRRARGPAPFRQPAGIPTPGNAAAPSSSSISVVPLKRAGGRDRIRIARCQVHFADRFVQGDTIGTWSTSERGQTIERAQAILLCNGCLEMCLWRSARVANYFAAPLTRKKRLFGRGKLRLSRSVLPSYSRRNRPRRCNSGTTCAQKSSRPPSK